MINRELIAAHKFHKLRRVLYSNQCARPNFYFLQVSLKTVIFVGLYHLYACASGLLVL